MPRFFVVCIVLAVLTGRVLGQTSRFVIDDEAYKRIAFTSASAGQKA